jgi:hypothetical protein
MATASYNFQGYSENANPIGNGWSRTIVAGSGATRTSAVILGSTPISGVNRFWRQTITTDTEFWRLMPSDVPTRSGISQCLALVRRIEPSGSNRTAQFGPGVGPGHPCHYVALTPTQTCGGAAFIFRGRDGDGINTSDGTFTAPNPCYGNWLWYRFEVEGSGSSWTVRGKMWKDGDTEPTSWISSSSSDSFGTGLGIFMLNMTSSETQFAEIAYFSVGTAGDSAPGPQEDTGLAFTGDPPRVTSRTTDSYTIGGTTNQDCTVFAVATETTATDPDGPQIAAGTDGDDAAAPGTGSVAATANTAFSLNITGTFTEATHDIHIVARREAE